MMACDKERISTPNVSFSLTITLWTLITGDVGLIHELCAVCSQVDREREKERETDRQTERERERVRERGRKREQKTSIFEQNCI